MGTQENKAVVSRFMNEVTTGRNTDPDLIDELLAPNYVNLAMGDADLAGFKAMAPHHDFHDEGSADRRPGTGGRGGRRFNHSVTLHDGSTTTHRALAYYRLAGGKIVVNDVMMVPDLMQVMAGLVAPQSEA